MSTFYPEIIIKKAKEYPIQNLLEKKQIQYQGNSYRYYLKCPIHSNHSKQKRCFSVYPKDNRWQCYASGISRSDGGDVIELYMKLYDVDFVSAVSALLILSGN